MLAELKSQVARGLEAAGYKVEPASFFDTITVEVGPMQGVILRARRIGFFPGSSIGNFHPPEAIAFLRRVRQTLGRGGVMGRTVRRRNGS
mgnify:CR=1 FL=1